MYMLILYNTLIRSIFKYIYSVLTYIILHVYYITITEYMLMINDVDISKDSIYILLSMYIICIYTNTLDHIYLEIITVV